MKELRGDHCRCSMCSLEFNSTYAFDKHRTGSWTARRCLSVEEMHAKGMVVSESGWWLSTASKRPIPASDAIAGAAIDATPVGEDG
jgi:hypothetical protein